MKRWLVGVGAFCVVAALSAGIARSFDIEIQVSPHVIVLRAQVPAVTVHTSIPYSTVDRGSVRLDGIVPTATFADDRGDLVAKFDTDDVRGIVAPPSATLTLTGTTIWGADFQGSETVEVRDH